MNSVQALSSSLQMVPLMKGKRRLGRLLIKLFRVDSKTNFWINTKAGRFFLPNLLDMISIDLFINGYYEQGLVELLVKNIPKHGVFVDVGANIGSISIALANRRKDITIVAVEASPWIHEVLQKNVAANRCANITVLNYAVYSQAGERLAMYAPKDLFGKGSLNSTFTTDAETVETITVDEIKRKFGLSSIHFIKVDVEGFEAAVFQGMSSTVATDNPQVIFEFSEWAETAAGFHPCEAQSLILSMGYKIQELNDKFMPIGKSRSEILKLKNANLIAHK